MQSKEDSDPKTKGNEMEEKSRICALSFDARGQNDPDLTSDLGQMLGGA